MHALVDMDRQGYSKGNSEGDFNHGEHLSESNDNDVVVEAKPVRETIRKWLYLHRFPLLCFVMYFYILAAWLFVTRRENPDSCHCLRPFEGRLCSNTIAFLSSLTRWHRHLS